VGTQPHRQQLVDGTPQVVLQLLDVGLPQLRPASQVAAPLRELRLQPLGTAPAVRALRAFLAGHGRTAAGIASVRSSPEPAPLLRSASTTVSHWRRCSASSASPAAVMR